MLVIVGAIMLIAGPTAGPKLIEALRSIHKVKSDLTGATAITKLLEVDKTLSSLADQIDPEDDVHDEP